MDPVTGRHVGFREALETTAGQLGLTIEEYFRFVNRLTAQIVAGIATIYQGWMTVYYLRRRAAVEQAVANLPEE